MSTQILTTPSLNQSLRKPLISDNIKTGLNLGFNGAAAGVNLITCINGNFPLLDSFQETMEWGSSVIAKLPTVSQGLINTTIAFEKKNIIALTGGLLELPIAILTSGYNLYLARGVSAGLNHFDSIISRTKKLDSENKSVKDTDGKQQYYDSFYTEGWTEGLKTIFKHLPKLTKEICEKPFERDGLFARSFFMCSVFMVIGPIIAFSGFDKIGAGIRHFFGGLAGVALATDQKKPVSSETPADQTVTSKGFSNYAMSGFFWVIAAIPDYFKRFGFFSDKINNSTELALCLDRLAGIFFIFGNQRKGEK